jgi:hypothetical protein
MYARLITFAIGLFCFVILATMLAQVLTNLELARRGVHP